MKRFICIVLSGLYGISYFFKNDIINLYIQLTQKINYDDNLARELNGLKNENQHLKDIISGSAYSSVTVDAAYTGLIEAHSSFFDRSNVIYGDIFLDKGYTEGIMKDSLVYVAGLKPVGTIKKVESGFSVLELFTSYKKEIGRAHV